MTKLCSKYVFKKVTEPSENSFRVMGKSDAYYEYQPSMVSRFWKRVNGLDLLLCEVCAYYEYAGADRSKTLYEVYKVSLSFNMGVFCIKFSLL